MDIKQLLPMKGVIEEYVRADFGRHSANDHVTLGKSIGDHILEGKTFNNSGKLKLLIAHDRESSYISI